ncbi:MAG: hypothetical protein ACQEVA_02605 [Myxococcota bacterium]
MNDVRRLTTDAHSVFEMVEVDESEPRDCTLDDSIKPLVFIDVIHDGHWLPPEFLVDSAGNPISLEQVGPDYVRERDWGAGFIAERLAQSLGLPGYGRVNVARVLMDFARFPGSTPRNADHLHRYAINYPFSKLLSHRQKKQVLEDYYDEVSAGFDAQLGGRLVKIAIHTYDQYNESGTERPAMSLMTRSIGYQTESEMPAGLFDPLYPDVLAEFTADRVLRDRISLTLEKAKIPVAHNYPYLLPEGSLEVRYQVWSFFRALRDEFEAEFPDTAADPSYETVWEMLFDTNLRSSESEAFRSFMHMYRRPPVGREDAFAAAEDSYEHVEQFCADRAEFIERYRFSRRRTSSIAIEVRKDLVCELGPDDKPVSVRWDNIRLVSDTLADAIATYFREDHDAAHGALPPGDLERQDPWYLS